MKTSIASRCAVILAALALAGAAHADSATTGPGDAKAHYNAATAHFAVGEFLEAGEEYNKAYKAKPDAAFLYNAAQSFRLAGANERALVLYKNYLHFYPQARNLGEVRTQIDKLQEAINATNSAKNNPPMNTDEPGHTTAPATEPSQAPATTPTAPVPVVATAPPPPDKPIYKKGWFWGVMAGVVVVVVVGVAVGVVEGSTTKSWSSAPPFGPGAPSNASLTVRF